MRGRSSRTGTGTGTGSKGGMEIDNLDNKLNKEEPHLSGAYIRSLVKQLTSSRTKDPMNPKHPDSTTADGDGFLPCPQNLTKFGEAAPLALGEGQPSLPPQQPQHHKKQVRRRLHTSRPYQERLLNMAEARREIVTALKFHRAAMKQANEQQQPPPQPLPLPQQAQPQSQPLMQPPGKTKSRRNPRIYPSSNSTTFSNYLENAPYSTFCCSSESPYLWPPASHIAPPAIGTHDNLNLNVTLPNQTLGLNLNIHEFNNLDTTLYNNSNNSSICPSWLSPSSSSSSSPSPSLFVAAGGEEIPSSLRTRTPVVDANIADPSMRKGGEGLSLHPAMDDEEMAEIRSIGEQHEVEWNDTLNLVTSAWWFKFLKTTEIGPEGRDKDDEDDGGYNPFDQLLEFPAWLNANDSCFHQRYLIDHCSDDYFQDPALPCMDIGEIEGMDGEWLA